MAYPKNGKNSKLKPVPRLPLSELSEIHKEAIFNHEECKKVFDERIQEVKLTVTDKTKVLIAAFKCVLPELSDKQLNLSDVDGEYEQLIEVLNTERNDGDIYPTHPGIFILMANLARQQPAKVYAADIANRCKVFTACKEVLKAVKALEVPVRDACVAEFYEKATQDQLDDIRITVKHRENPQGHGMPGNGAIPQFRM